MFHARLTLGSAPSEKEITCSIAFTEGVILRHITQATKDEELSYQ